MRKASAFLVLGLAGCFETDDLILLPAAFGLTAPADLATDVATSPAYSWAPSAGATSYTLQVSTSSTFATFVTNQAGILTTTASPAAVLSFSTTYFWRVYADAGSGSVLAGGAPRSFTTVPPPPGAFTLIAPANGATGVSATPTYSWNASGNAAGYTLQVSTSNVFASFVVDQSGIASTSAAPATVLAYSTTYYWRVYAVNASGSTLALGAPLSFTTQASPPGAFPLLGPANAAVAVETAPLYSWGAAANAMSYTLQVSTSPVFASFVIDQAGLSTTSLRPSTVLATNLLHYWRVTAHNLNGSTLTSSTAFSFTTTGAPVFNLSVPALSFTLTEGGVDPPDQGIDLTDNGALGSPVAWTVVSDQPWVVATPASGASIPAQVTPLNVHVDADFQIGGWLGATSTGSAPTARRLHAAVWTGSEMVVWGGSQTPAAQFADGGRYDPVGNAWLGSTSTLGAPTPRHGHTGVWSGTEMVIWGGVGTTTSFVNTGGFYAPDAWFGATSLSGVPAVRETHAAVWTGGEMIVWGGWNNALLTSGGRYNRAGDLWTDSTSTVGHPGGRLEHVAVWSGNRMVVWGGRNGGDASSSLNSGGFYDPGSDQWTGATSLAGVPSGRTAPSAVFTGREMILWGGHDGADYLDTGARFHPETNTWLGPLPTAGAPAPRYRHRAVWTGSQMIVWGGEDGSSALNTGGIYQPPIPGLGIHTVTLTVTATGPGGTRVQTIPITVTVTP